jgi:pimeloyl-ACP methyl ester carboxylesterase
MPDIPRPAVVCLHSSAASGKQWRRLVADGGDAWQWHTPDLFGHGGRPGWPELMPSQLSVEANGVLSGLALPREQAFHLVGHSYGGAVALQIALQQPRRVLSLTLYEPVAFGLLPALGPREPAWQEITDIGATLGAALDQGDAFGAARGFCAYWHGRDVWPDLDEAQRQRLAQAMPTVRRHFERQPAWPAAHAGAPDLRHGDSRQRPACRPGPGEPPAQRSPRLAGRRRALGANHRCSAGQ